MAVVGAGLKAPGGTTVEQLRPAIDGLLHRVRAGQDLARVRVGDLDVEDRRERRVGRLARDRIGDRRMIELLVGAGRGLAHEHEHRP